MSSQNVIFSVPASQAALVQEYLSSMQNDAQDDQRYNEVIDYVYTCKDYEVKRVIGHRINGSSDYWEFQIMWSNGDIGWIPDSECNCEVLITDYLKSININTVYVFCRVSTKQQNKPECVSLDAQLNELIPLARQCPNCQRIKVVKISKGAYRNIPKEMLDICDSASKGDFILIYRIDRLSRNIFNFLQEIESLNEREVQVYSHQDKLWYSCNRTDFVQKILNAQKESELIGNRVKMSINYRIQRGDRVGRVPYGMKYIRNEQGVQFIVPNQDEVEIIKKVKMLNGYPIDVANYLNSEGIKKRGRFWTPAMVENIWSTFNADGSRQ